MADTNRDVPEGLDDVLASIGALVIHMQTTERVIASALTHALTDATARTVDQLTDEMKANNRATIGSLVRKLKQKVDVHEDFERLLESFLEDRNSLIHDIDRIPGFDLQSEAGIGSANSFLSKLLGKAEMVTKVFLAASQEWAEEVGYPSGKDPFIHRYLGEYRGSARVVFRRKTD